MNSWWDLNGYLVISGIVFLAWIGVIAYSNRGEKRG